MPLLFVCEDNGIGISVAHPAGWVEQRLRRRGRACEYFAADGLRPAARLDAAAAAADCVRATRRAGVPAPAHGPADGPRGLRRRDGLPQPGEIAADLRARPAARAPPRLLVERRRARPRRGARPLRGEARARSCRSPTRSPDRAAARLAPRQVMAPLRRTRRRGRDAARGRARAGRAAGRSAAAAREAGPLTLAQSINRALCRRCSTPYPEALRVRRGRRGARAASTASPRGLQQEVRRRPRVRHAARRADHPRPGARRRASSGLLPIPEIQYLAYLHNAEDQLRGEAATLQFFSNGQYRNPMVVRIAGLRLPEGLRRPLPQRQRDRRAARHPRPGRRLAGTPGRRGGDAAHAASPRRRTTARSCVFLEPIALYHTRDLHEADDGGGWRRTPRRRWAARHVPIGRGRTPTATART